MKIISKTKSKNYLVAKAKVELTIDELEEIRLALLMACQDYEESAENSNDFKQIKSYSESYDLCLSILNEIDKIED